MKVYIKKLDLLIIVLWKTPYKKIGGLKMKDIEELQEVVYSYLYDELDSYGQGVRDVLNYLSINGVSGCDEVTQKGIIEIVKANADVPYNEEEWCRKCGVTKKHSDCSSGYCKEEEK